jgi:hypothetical protein
VTIRTSGKHRDQSCCPLLLLWYCMDTHSRCLVGARQMCSLGSCTVDLARRRCCEPVTARPASRMAHGPWPATKDRFVCTLVVVKHTAATGGGSPRLLSRTRPPSCLTFFTGKLSGFSVTLVVVQVQVVCPPGSSLGGRRITSASPY